MFNKSIDDRLSIWFTHRTEIENSETPFEDVWRFWKDAPFVPYNKNIDPYFQHGWPSPWEIIVNNRYDDFTRALMIGWTLTLTKRFKESKIEIKTIVDKIKPSQYNVVCIEDWGINYSDVGPILLEEIPDSFFLENLIELKAPR